MRRTIVSLQHKASWWDLQVLTSDSWSAEQKEGALAYAASQASAIWLSISKPVGPNHHLNGMLYHKMKMKKPVTSGQLMLKMRVLMKLRTSILSLRHRTVFLDLPTRLHSSDVICIYRLL